MRPMREQDEPTARRRRASRIPLWIRVSVSVVAVLAGILLSTMLVSASGVGDRSGSAEGHGSGGGTEMTDDGGSGGDHSSRGDRSGGDHSGGDHSGGSHGGDTSDGGSG